MKDAIAAAWEGKNPRPDLEAAGQAGADGIRAYIDAHIPPPNSPATVSGGWIYNRAAKKAVYVKGKGFNKGLSQNDLREIIRGSPSSFAQKTSIV